MKYLITFLFITLLLANTPIASAFEFSASTLRGFKSRASFEIFAFRGHKRGREWNYEERQTFVSTESVNITATITVDNKDIGHTAPLYIVAIANGQPYIKISSGQWIPWDGSKLSLQAVESRTLKAQEPLEIAFGLTGIRGNIDVYVAYGNSASDIVYNELPLALKIKDYSGVLTVGEHGQYSGCSGLKRAINTVQDLGEIRIEQGSYPCTGLEIAIAKQFDFGIKISGGWDSRFQTQTRDPLLTVIDGGAEAHLTQGFNTVSACIETLNTSKLEDCFTDDITIGPMLTINEEPVTIELLTFKNNYSGRHLTLGGLGAIRTDNHTTDIKIDSCQFEKLTGGAVVGANIITNSVFINNHSIAGGAVNKTLLISNSTFFHNTANIGGAVHATNVLINNLFFSNQVTGLGSRGSIGGEGGAVANVRFILNNTFINNTAENIGGAFSGGGVILNSVFSGNKAAGQNNDINSNGFLFLDYSLFNHQTGGADFGLHNVMGDPLYVNPDSHDYRLQANSPARNMGNNEFLERNAYLYYYFDDIYTDYYDFPRNISGTLIDLNGDTRIRSSSVDIGAYEYQ